MTSATWAREHFDLINGHTVTLTGQAEISAQAFGKVLAEEANTMLTVSEGTRWHGEFRLCLTSAVGVRQGASSA